MVSPESIKFGFLKCGGFAAADPITRLSVYAYPGSESVASARRNPAQTALEMIARECEASTWFFHESNWIRYARESWRSIAENVAAIP